jgi:hypothetical protein
MKATLIVVIIALALFGGALAVNHAQEERIMRRVAITEGKSLLKAAYRDYLQRGYVTNGNRNYHVWQPTNALITIAGRQYECVLAIRVGKAYGSGALAMTTNYTFIWLDDKRPPKIINGS